jgi:Glutathione S-transferase, N-terminal domain
MLQLYFWPMACSLASRIALMEAGIEARYRLMHLWNKTIVDDGSDFRSVSSKGAVPVLILENGERLTESAAVLQYIADLKPELGLAPPPGTLDRYRVQEWLSFVGCEIHKAFLFPTFWYKDDAAKAAARERIGQSSRSPPSIWRTGPISSANGLRSRTPISPGRCCCSAAPASMSRNGRHWSTISNACAPAPTSRRRSNMRSNYGRR